MTNEQVSLESWDDFLDEFVKPSHLKKWPAELTVINANVGTDRNDKSIVIFDIHVEGNKYKWQPNATQMKALRKLGVSSPKAILQKRVIMDKVKVRNPKTGETVDSFDVKEVK